MALTPCDECAREISSRAAMCPHCGAPQAAGVAGDEADPATALLFRNPKGGRLVDLSNSGLWTLLFGCFYFTLHGVLLHAVISAVAAICTFGLSWLIYPFFGRRIMRTHFREHGWLAVARASALPIDRSRDKYVWWVFVFITLLVLIAAAIARH